MTQSPNDPIAVDFLVIGSGIAGLTYALQTARHGSTLILTKKNRAESNSNYAQGGIAGVMSDDDSVALHAQDTINAGAGLCHEDAVQVLVTEGRERIADLIRMGARFSMEKDSEGREALSLGREGGHSRNRIVHAVDRTGWEIERTLLAAAKDLPNLRILEHYFVTDLIVSGDRCVGASAIDSKTGGLVRFQARSVLLATGGCGQVYLYTTNPAIATGDGIAMAWRAGATIANMEFIQFHPTALYHPKGRSFLISEAVRGEGGILRAKDGSTFMEQYDSRKELAPRDIVARAIHAERLKRGDPCVYLDVTHLDAGFVRARFPTIYERCLSLGIDITKQPIPVVPAAHYACGGVQTDLVGRTGIMGLYACGEVACTGVHGANRLASNSLLEAMVFGYRAARSSVEDGAAPNYAGHPDTVDALIADSAPLEATQELRTQIQTLMNDGAGIVRNTRALSSASEQLAGMKGEADSMAGRFPLDPNVLEIRNMATVGQVIVRSALTRKESRGLHYTTDYPEVDDTHFKRDSILTADSPTPAVPVTSR